MGPVVRRTLAERLIGRTLFLSRWLGAPIYLGLIGGMLIVLMQFAVHAYELLVHAATLSTDMAVVGVLSLVDLSLVANLLVMVMFAGYESFVSTLGVGDDPDRPDWMGHIGFSELKLKLMTSIVAISAIHLLENFMDVGRFSDRELAWSTGLHLAFVLSALALTLMDRMSDHH